MKKLSLLLLLPFFMLFACSDDKSEIDPDNGKTVELIFNEPLTSMFGKSLEDIKKTETRELIESSETSLSYKDSKNKLNYSVIYVADNNNVTYMSCKFEGLENLETLEKNVSERYTNKLNKVVYLSDKKDYIIYFVTQTPYIEIVYEPK